MSSIALFSFCLDHLSTCEGGIFMYLIISVRGSIFYLDVVVFLLQTWCPYIWDIDVKN